MSTLVPDPFDATLPGTARERRHYVSIDSAPPLVAVERSHDVAPRFLLVFAAVTAALLALSPGLEAFYAWLLRAFLEPFDRGTAAPESFPLRLRPFFPAFFVAYAALAAGSAPARLRLAATAVATYLAAALALDGVVLAIAPALTQGVLLTAHVLTGFAGLATLVVVVLAQALLPQDDRVERSLPYRPGAWIRLAAAVALAGTAAALLSAHAGTMVDAIRGAALLGGVGPGIVLFFPLLGALLVAAARLELAERGRAPDARAPSIAFLVPAFNEERDVDYCISSIELAAAGYPGPCHLYLIDNGSHDATLAAARAQVARSATLDATVLQCRSPGKAKALNHGLAHASEEVVVRVDADTTIDDEALLRCMRHFADESVGVVGGMPLPRRDGSLLERLRDVEVHLMHGYGRVGAVAVEALLAVPGTFAAYRRSCLRAIGGFAEGMNGEDTDAALRIGRLGYRVVTDPGVRVRTEVPASFEQLREQRLRWSRSTFHVAARNRSAMARLEGVRGALALPWALLHAGRRALGVPLLVYAGLVLTIAPSALFLREGAAVAAIVVGAPFLVSIGVLTGYRRFDLLASLPAYLAFRLLRSYLALESLFTLPFERRRRPAAVASPRR